MKPNMPLKTLRVFTFFVFLFICSGFQAGHCEAIELYKEGPVHEAFFSKSSGHLVLRGVSIQPPESIKEVTPRQIDMQSVWIPGYWFWDTKKDAFIWVSGVWRRPPPGHQWISGFWEKLDKDWVWIAGYWSKAALQSASYIGVAPPDALDENVVSPPGENYFWVPGFWYFLSDKNEYRWVLGHWEGSDPNWVLIPAHYIWRPDGYVFISSYWDWPLEDRGTAYSPVVIKTEEKTGYEPSAIYHSDEIVRALFLHYPDYPIFFQHHMQFHPDFWEGFCCQPPWWKWSSWWCFSWHDQWALWWWYLHPGYSQPAWMTKELGGILPPPSEKLVQMGKESAPSLIVTSKGVVKIDALLAAIQKATGRPLPIFPAKKRLQEKVYQNLALKLPESDAILKPSGRRLPIDPMAVRPNVKKPVVGQTLFGEEIPEALKPAIPSKPKIPSHSRSLMRNATEKVKNTPLFTPAVQRPIWDCSGEMGKTTGEIKEMRKKDKELQELHKKWNS